MNLDVSAYHKVIYEMTRKGKMYQKNTVQEGVDIADLLIYLNGIGVNEITLQCYFTRFSTDPIYDLKAPYPEKMILALWQYGLLNNLPLTLKNIYCDGNVFIFEIQCQGTDKELRKLLKDILSHEATAFVSKIEIQTHGPSETLFFRLLGAYHQVHHYEGYPSLFPSPLPPANIEVLLPVPLQPSIDYDTLDSYYHLLEKFYRIFYTDVQNRACTVWCLRDGMAEYIVKRQINDQPIIFPSRFLEVEPVLQFERIVQVVSNNTELTAKYPTELIIDVDVPSGYPYELVKLLTEGFNEWLVSKEYHFMRRVTGSRWGGQHFILPIKWMTPYLLGGKTDLWENYLRRISLRVLCDSVQCTAELLCLLFQRDNKDLAPYLSTRIFDPYNRYQRILLDTTSNIYNRGRRALLSLHKNGRGVCLPLNSDLPATAEEYEDYCSLETLLTEANSLPKLLTAPPTKFQATHNTQLLEQMVLNNDHLYQEYLMLPAMRFEALYFNIAPGEKPHVV